LHQPAWALQKTAGSSFLEGRGLGHQTSGPTCCRRAALCAPSGVIIESARRVARAGHAPA